MATSRRCGLGPRAPQSLLRPAPRAHFRNRRPRIRCQAEPRTRHRTRRLDLNDPIEDDPNHSWDDYRANWESTLTASLFQAEVWHYEIMPWPHRVFNGKYPVKSVVAERSASEAEQVPEAPDAAGFCIPGVMWNACPSPRRTKPSCKTLIHALGEVKQPDVRWESSRTQNTGVLVSGTLMFQRAAPHPFDASLGSFYGLALPLLNPGCRWRQCNSRLPLPPCWAPTGSCCSLTKARSRRRRSSIRRSRTGCVMAARWSW